MRVAILQSNYLPWKGYFDMIKNVDLFIFHDDLQYTKLDWRNRNKIKTISGSEWLTIPCGTDTKRKICEVKPSDYKWQKSHWSKIIQNYSKAANFGSYKDFFENYYLGNNWDNLSELNQYLIKNIAKDFLFLETKFDDSRNYNLYEKKEKRVVELLQQVQATVYLSGPSGKNYLSDEDFKGTDIKLEWMDYSFYPEYNQFFPPFDHFVSIIDLLFHKGDISIDFLNRVKS